MAGWGKAERIQRAADLLRSARHAVVFSGAGISTPSGIPDFRSPGSGLWTKNDPLQVASLSAFRFRPRSFFDWLRPLAAAGFQARPNPAHLAVARLQNAGIIKTVITQNIDGLHQQAGAVGVLELHGTMASLTCPSCGMKYAVEDYWDVLMDPEQIPHCKECRAVVKPDVVLFEESLPVDVWEAAEDESRRADLMVVVGSALEVMPANMLPLNTLESGGRLIINTISSTYLDHKADVLLPYDVAEIMPAIAKLVLDQK